MNEKILKQLKIVYATLDTVNVTGGSNIEKLYGCFVTLANLIRELEAEEQGGC